MCALVNIDAQKIGCLYSPLDMSQFRTRPGLSVFSAPTTRAVSPSPEDIWAYAEIKEFVPELHRLSTEWDILGWIPDNSDMIFAR